MPVYNDLVQVLTSNNTLSVFYDDNLSFGDTNKGYVMTDISSNNILFNSVIDYEDRIIVGVVGIVGIDDSEQQNNFVLYRFNANGSLDETFGIDGNGKVSTDIQSQNNNDYAFNLAIDTQNRIIVCGYTDVSGSENNNLWQFAVVRYKSNGQLDLSFGDNGFAVLNIILNYSSVAFAVTVDSYDRILVAGFTDTSGNQANFAVIRLTNNGFLDITFGDDGKIDTDIIYNDNSGNADFATGIVVDSQDRIIVNGYIGYESLYIVIVRYNSDGQIDTSFGSDGTGMVNTNILSTELGMSVVIDSLDRIVLGGTLYDVSGDHFAVIRYTLDGVVDPTFGTNGITITQLLGNVDQVATRLTIDNQDRIVIIGQINVENEDFVVIRYDTSGNLDSSFGNSGGGFVITDISGNDNYATGVAIDSHNKIIVSGSGNGYFVIARYNDNGELDTEDRFYNKISLDGGVTWKPINHYNKFRSKNYKNLLIIPNINNTIDQYSVVLKTTNANVTNTFTLPNDIQQEYSNTKRTSAYILPNYIEQLYSNNKTTKTIDVYQGMSTNKYDYPKLMINF
jgi:uncharacterized delta-60 repeat protein